MAETNEKDLKDDKDQKDEKAMSFEKMCALSLALLAAVLAVTDLGAGKYSSAYANSQRAYMHEWYNAKGIKQNLAESHAEMLTALVDSGSISKILLPVFRKQIDAARSNVARYKLE